MTEYAIIPRPRSVQYQEGCFESTGLPRIVLSDSQCFQGEAQIFTSQILKTFGTSSIKSASSSGNIHLYKINDLQAEDKFHNEESFKLEILKGDIRLSACEGTGLFRGLQVLRQIFLSGWKDGKISIPCGIIEDEPRFAWRGLMLDCSRNFYSVSFIKKLLDALSLQHINIFHWHLTDDQGWRLPVKKYPLLTEIGSRRLDSRKNNRYIGGFYTEKDIKNIVSYAAGLHIEVVPEVDLPGHTSAILAAYPGLGCTGGPYRVEERYGIMEDVLCAGNDEIFTLAEAIFDTLAEFFPSKYVHIGGDEVRFNRWNECLKCRKRLEELDLDEAPQLQSWITCRLAEMLQKRGKTAIGWEEVLENTEKFPLPENVVVMSWRSQAGGNKAAALGRRVIMSPKTDGCYLDYKHTDDPEEPGQLGICTIKQGFNMKPITPEMGEAVSSLVLGGQGNLWSEIIYAGKIAEYMIFPRICAIAETMWSAGENRDINEFAKRLTVHQSRLDRLGILQYRGPLE